METPHGDALLFVEHYQNCMTFREWMACTVNDYAKPPEWQHDSLSGDEQLLIYQPFNKEGIKHDGTCCFRKMTTWGEDYLYNRMSQSVLFYLSQCLYHSTSPTSAISNLLMNSM